MIKIHMPIRCLWVSQLILLALYVHAGPLERQLITAIQDADRSQVHKIVSSSNVDINALEKARDFPDPVTPLMVAVYKSDPMLVQQLLSFGADIDKQDAQGRTPLMYAHRVSIVTKLLEQSPNLSVKDANGNSILHWVIGSGLNEYMIGSLNLSMSPQEIIDIVVILLQEKVDPNGANVRNQLPVDLALWRESQASQKAFTREWLFELVLVLSAAGAHMGANTMRLIKANFSEQDQKSLLRLLAPQEERLKEFVHSAYKGNLIKVKGLTLWIKDKDVLVALDEPTVSRPVNALMAAVIGGKKDVVAYLLAQGVSPLVEDQLGRIPLVYATTHLDIFTTIMEKMHAIKASPLILGKALAACLYYALDQESIDNSQKIIAQVMNGGADINATYLGYSPLLAVLNNAVAYGDQLEPLVAQLISAGASPEKTVVVSGTSMNAFALAQDKLAADPEKLSTIIALLRASSLSGETGAPVVSEIIGDQHFVKHLESALQQLVEILGSIKRML